MGRGVVAGVSTLADLPFSPPLAPMEAKLVDVLPDGDAWQYEPKWDGFRCLAFCAGDEVALQSKGLRPLGRFFPEVTALLAALPVERFILDAELIIPLNGVLSFDALQMRLHPAESRIRKLAAETPARLMLFDLLAWDDRDLSDAPLSERRAALQAFHAVHGTDDLLLSPATQDHEVACGWLELAGGALDGVVAKRLDATYAPGERAMQKVKQIRTADCVVGGFRYASKGKGAGSLLLGLFNADGALDHVGFTSNMPGGAARAALTRELESMAGGPGFTGRAPGGRSRWATDRSAEWVPLRHERVVEVRYDQVTADRFRHGTGFVRWRPDKAPEQCRTDQLIREAAVAIDLEPPA